MLNDKELHLIIAQYAATNPARAVLQLLTMPQVSRYLCYAVDEKKLQWLSAEIQTHPLRALQFVIGKDGKDAVNFFIDAYEDWVSKESQAAVTPKSTSFVT